MTEPRSATERQAARADLATRAFVVFVVVVSLASLCTLAVLAVQDHHRIEQNNAIQAFIARQAVENGQLSEVIKDCTTPEGQCYQRSQRQTGGAVANINRVTVLAAACAVGLDPTLPVSRREALIRACVVERLAR